MSNGSWSNVFGVPFTIPQGAVSGARTVIGGGANLDAILVYDAAGALIASVAPEAEPDGLGNTLQRGVSVYNTMNRRLVMDPAGPDLRLLAAGATQSAVLQTQPINADSVQLAISSGQFTTEHQAIITVLSEDANTTLPSRIVMTAGGIGATGNIQGCAMQNDNAATQPFFQHTEVYSVSFAAGSGTLTHNCNFTPKNAVMTSTGSGSPLVTQVTYTQPIGATTATVQAYQANGTAYTGTGNISAVFYG